MKTQRLIDLFIADVCAGKLNETEKAYRTKLAQLHRFIKDRPITDKLLKGFMIDLKTRKTHMMGYSVIDGGLSIYTIKTVFQVARHFCKWLYDNGHIDQEIHKLVKIPSAPPPTPKAISEESFNAIVQAAIIHNAEPWERARDVAILYCLRDTGGRVGGLANIQIPNIDLKLGEISTIEKGKNITLFLNPPTIEAIKYWLIYRPTLEPITESLFIGKWTRQGLTRQGVTRMLNKLAKAAGITERHNPHSFRHAFARDFLRDGGEITQLAGLMHHSSIWVTSNYYARWNDSELRSAHQKHSPINSINPEI